MGRLTKAIGTDVETALVRMRESNRCAEANRRDHEETVRDLRANLSRQEKRADVLQAKNSGLEDMLENAKEELEKARQRAVILEEENENLDETLKDARRQISDLTIGNNILQSQTGALVESKLELEKTVITLRKEVVDSRDAHLETERRFQALLNESREEADSVKKVNKKEIERLQQEIASLRLANPTREDKERVKSTPDDISSKECHKETIVKPEDDPVADMTRQLITNREKIEVLTRQNERLSKTLSRLKEYRLTAQSMSNSSRK
ncbi:tropomyosin Tod p 1.0102-like [Hylaeus volcanicus]|uniref:tropomyosin Tod p 1.0102-like n=1 Tax=Hylaeus volcanicus TaxID=313075 RepID=UPI0023B8194F|nr:tropomyosin Tod p 1.0102-like [Hylaeus volcanicus]